MKRKKISKCCDPAICDHCIYIGEGDFICDKCNHVLVLEDFTPTPEYMICMDKSYMNSLNVSSSE